MAVVRARSAPPYGLIAFVALWLISTGLAIFAYIGYGKANDELASYKRSTEAANKKNTTNEQFINELKQIVGGNTAFDNDGIKKLVTTTLANAKRAGSEPLTTALNNVAKERDDRATALAQANARLEGIDKEISSKGTTAQNNAATLTGELAKVQQQLVAANAALAQANAERDDAVKKGQESINKMTEDAEQARRTSVLAIEQLNKTVEDLTTRNKELLARLNAGKTETITTGEADGNIVGVSPTTGEVYINLSKKDRVVAGTTFTIFDARAGVRYGTDELAQGKGSIEVIQVGDTSSLARVTRTTKGQSLQTGDIIANLAFNKDRSRKTRFTIVGDFDLDGDGAATAGERERLVNLITSWGGQVDNGVSTQTDYVVSGVRPTTSTMAETAPGSADDARKTLQTQYDDVVAEAKKLSIPVLNQNRFLNLIGYYNTTIVR